MEKLIETIQRIGNPIAAWMNQNKVICAIRDGMMATIPVSIVGAVFLIAMQFPYLDQFAPEVSTWLMTNCWQIYLCTFGIITLFILLATAYSYAGELGVDKLFAIIAAVIAFLILTPIDGAIPQSNLASDGMFPALIITILSVRLYAFVVEKDIVIKMPDQVPENVARSFTSILPLAAVIVASWILRLILLKTPYLYLHNFINQVFGAPLMAIGTGPVAPVIFTVIQQLLWWLGIHGANIIMAVYQPILMSAAAANVEASLAGLPLPYAMSYTWWFTYTTMFNLAIPLALIIGGKSKRVKTVGKMSVVPAAFCIHEPVFFGLPVVLNPIMFVPFVLGYTVVFIFTYVMTSVGIAPMPVNSIPWTTPPIIGGLLATNFNIMGAVMQVASIALGVLIYLPFVKVLDKQYLEEEAKREAQ